ncbi:hypothetical protein BH11BAC3_BH11BAC3_11850 [soil metagenome]
MKKFTPLFIALFIIHVAFAQQPKQYSFTHYSTSSGLLSNQVFTTVQDEAGFIWIGGTDGLQRFDGTRYKSFRHRENDASSLPSNPIMQLMLDKQKRLWVLLFDGSVGIFNTKKFTFDKVPVETSIANATTAEIKRLITDETGNIFFLIQGSELVTLNEKQHQFSYRYNFFKQLPDWGISDFIQQPGTQKYWIGIQGAGIVIFNKATGSLSYAGNNVEREPAVEAFEKNIFPAQMMFDKKGRCWFICWSTVFAYVYCYDTKTNQYEKYELLSQLRAYHEINSVMQQQDGSIWIKGVKVFAKFIEKEKKFQLIHNGYNSEHSISFNIITSLYEDREKNIWVGTNNNGLYRFNPSMEYFTNIMHYNRSSSKPGNGSVMSFMPTKWGTCLVGTWEDGLYNYDSNFNTIPLRIKGIDDKHGPFIWSMFASKDSNTIWMSSQPGIYALNQDRRVAAFYNPPVLQNKTIRQIAEDKAGNIWLGIQHSGLYKWRITNEKNIASIVPEKISFIPDESVNKLLIDKKGWIWVATDKHGAYVIDPAHNKLLLHFAKDAANELKLPQNDVSSILEYNDSLMVITCATRIVVYNRFLKQSYLVSATDVISGNISSVEKDSKGHIWVSCSSGIRRVNIFKGIQVHFTTEDGIENDNFERAASHALPDGRLIFGSSDQFIIFYPPAIKINMADSNITITDIQVMNKSLPVDSVLQLKEINLGYQENSLNISFSSLLYNTAYVIKYKLEGADNNWKLADENNNAIYSYLPPGSYTFKFQMIDAERNIKTSALQLRIVITPPFWKSWWFYSLLALLTGSILFWLDKERMQRKEAVQKMRSNIASNLHEEVNTALGNIHILSEMAKLKADTAPQKSKEFIEQIHTKSGNMIVALDDMLWSISPDNDGMEKLLERLQEHLEVLKATYNISIVILADEKVINLKLNMKKRQDIFWFLKNGVSNMARAGATDLKMHIGIDKSQLIYTLEFDNSMMDKQQMYNLLQRQELENKLKETKTKMAMHSIKNNSVIELKVPVV